MTYETIQSAADRSYEGSNTTYYYYYVVSCYYHLLVVAGIADDIADTLVRWKQNTHIVTVTPTLCYSNHTVICIQGTGVIPPEFWWALCWLPLFIRQNPGLSWCRVCAIMNSCPVFWYSWSKNKNRSSPLLSLLTPTVIVPPTFFVLETPLSKQWNRNWRRPQSPGGARCWVAQQQYQQMTVLFH